MQPELTYTLPLTVLIAIGTLVTLATVFLLVWRRGHSLDQEMKRSEHKMKVVQFERSI